MFQAAIVRPPSATFSRGLTTSTLAPPDLDLALAQHEAYRRALERCGLRVILLEPDPEHPDSTFVEDAAVISPGGAILTRPGAPSRRGEVDSIRRALEPLVPRLRAIVPPGTLDGGDVCQAEAHFFIGISQRTNLAGARQLAALLAEDGCTSTLVDIRAHTDLLHLKSGLASLDARRLVAADPLAAHPAFHGFEVVRVEPEEAAGANCVLIHDQVLVAAGCEKLEIRLGALGYSVLALEMSEFQKMDGGLSCLSLRLLSAQGAGA